MSRGSEGSSSKVWSWPESIRHGAGAAWPIYLGYVPIGLAFGVLAEKTGLDPLEVGLMSLLVFAGSSQFIAVSMLGGGAGAAAIVATTFVVNLRHLLMSSALALHISGLSRGRLAWFGFGVTDESFALNSARFREGDWDWRPSLVVNQTSHAVWTGTTVAGAWAGKLVPAGAFGMDYALIAMFLSLLALQLQERRFVLSAAASGLLAVALRLWVPGNAYVILASVPAAALGAALAGRGRGRSERGKTP
ncbi:MAG: AzlC family ABC transporter permease [Desulfobacteraceae bacterium]